MRAWILLVSTVVAAGCELHLGTLLGEREVEPVCTDEGSIVCGVGACLRTVPACVDGVAATCAPGAPEAEVCNDLDDDCDGAVDDGCDDDEDGYCDAQLSVIGRPKACPVGGAELLDCDDTSAERNPGRQEVCEDGLDNDCDGLVDFLDIQPCTHVTATFQDGDGVVSLIHGDAQVLRANLTPPAMELSRRWAVTRALPDIDCFAEDVTIEDPEERPDATLRRVSIVDDPAKLACRYELTLFVAGEPADRITLSMRNPRPRVDEVIGATLEDGELVLRVAAGTNPWLRAVVPEDDDLPVVVEWAGQSASLLDCGSPCTGDRVRFLQPIAKGTYRFTLRARDAFDGRRRGRALRVEAVDCVWVNASGTGSGTGPGPAAAFGDLEEGVAAALEQGADVCISGGGTFDLGASLSLPHGVVLNAAFAQGGMPSDARALLRFAPGARLRFAPGYDASVRRVRVEGTGGGPAIDVLDASPSLYGVAVTVSPAPGASGIRIRTSSGDPIRVRVFSSLVTAAPDPVDATGIRVVGNGGTAELEWSGDSAVELEGCTGVCRGVLLQANARGVLLGDRVDVEAIGAGSRAVGIDVAGTENRPATAEIRGLRQVFARTRATSPADHTVAIRLSRTDGVRILDNNVVGPTYFNSGRFLSAGVADGEVRRDGTFEPGGSTDLRIADNRQIVAGRSNYAWNGATCADPPADREGTDVGAGILLVGTASATLENNGRFSSRDTGVFGAASSAVWDPAERVLPPSVPGVWTIDTADVQILRNELRAGVLSTPSGCVPDHLPHVAAVRDGLGPFVTPSHASRRLRLEANGIVTGRRGNFDPVPNVDQVGARLVELSGGAGGSAYLANNYLAVTRGTDLVGLYAHRTEDVELVNNTIQVAVITSSGAAVKKRGVVLDEVVTGSFSLVNNIITVDQNDADAPDPVAIEVWANENPQPLRALSHNLLFVEAAERNGLGSYVRSGGMSFTRTTFSQFAADIGAEGNLLLPPLLRMRQLEHRRSLTQLSRRSPARDAGRLEGAPEQDRFGRSRPAGPGVDIGHHELVP